MFMIDSITGIDGVRCIGGWNQLPSFSMDNKMSDQSSNFKNGDVRFNGVIQTLECYSDGHWIPVSSGPVTVELTPDVKEVIEWSQKKRREDERIRDLMERHPSVKSAKNQLDVLVALLKDEENQTGNSND